MLRGSNSLRSLARRAHTSSKTSEMRKRRRLARRMNLEGLEQRQMLASDTLNITIENLSADGGLGQTPFWVAVHDGSFDVGTSGESASNFGGLELLAEEGDVSGVRARFAAESSGTDTAILAPGGFSGVPVFEPGEVVTEQLMVDDKIDKADDAFQKNMDHIAPCMENVSSVLANSMQ